MNIKTIIINGTLLITISNIFSQLISVIVTIILARILDPKDYGLVALCNVVIGFISVLTEIGLGTAVIQRKNVTDAHYATAYWATIISAIVLCIITIILSPIVAKFYSEQLLVKLINVMAIGFILTSLTSIHTAILNKKLEFAKIVLVRIYKTIIVCITSIMLAINGFGVWSLILGGLVAQVITMPLVWKWSKWKPKFVFDISCFKELFGFSSYILGFNTVNYFSRNADDMIVGKLLGPFALGNYSIAYELMKKPLQHISSSVGSVLFPVFSTVQNDKEQIGRIYLKVVRTISIITFPVMVGLSIISDEFILLLYGNKWHSAIYPLKILCFVGAIQSVESICGNIFISQGRSDIQFKWSIYFVFATISSFLIGAKYGLNGVVNAYALVCFISFPIGNYLALRLINLRLYDFFNQMFPAFISTAIMAMTVIAVKSYMYINAINNNYLICVVSILTGIVSYAFLIKFVFKTTEINEIFNILLKKNA